MFMPHKPRRIPLWFPAIVTLLVAIGIRYQNFREQEHIIIADVSTRKGYDARLMADFLAARLALADHSWQQQAAVVESALLRRHRSTLAIVSIPDQNGDPVISVSNATDLKKGLFDGVQPLTRTLEDRRNADGIFPPEGITFDRAGHKYLMHLRTFPIAIPKNEIGARITTEAEVILITDLTAATENTRETAIFWGSSLIIIVTIGICCILLINIMPFDKLSRAVRSGNAIYIPRWWPGVAVELAESIENYRAEVLTNRQGLETALATAEKLTEEIQNVNHIAVHDIKADLTALNKGSEVIQETVAELLDYIGPDRDAVVIDALETIKFFSDLNINSAKNAFDVLDQRNKLYNLESKIEIGDCSVAEIFKALQASFSAEAGELRIYNDCPENRMIKADFSLLLTVLKNIIRNGFIHNDSPLKRVEVRVGPHGHRSRIQITDNGVGMPASYLENWGKILGKSAQLDNKRGGSGTGLYSIRAIIMAHKDASIEIESAVGQGTTFTLEFNHVA